MTRRRFLVLAGGLAGAGLLRPWPLQAATLPGVRPREDWGAALPPRGPMEVEAPGDVRFLLLHHSASGNSYAPRDVPGILGSFYRHHTGARGWPDIAYNFLVDRYGTVWEGRAGSLEQPVRGDATGGSQGFALLACFVGDHSAEPPTPEAAEAMAALCAGLAQRYGIDTAPGTLARFVSRGSNKHPPGSPVETATIAGHRDMSHTACPGEAGYALVTGDLPARAATLQASLRAAGTPQGSATPDAEATAATEGLADPHARGGLPPGPEATPATGPSPATGRPAPAGGDGQGGGVLLPVLLGLGGLATAAAVSGGIASARRDRPAPDDAC